MSLKNPHPSVVTVLTPHPTLPTVHTVSLSPGVGGFSVPTAPSPALLNPPPPEWSAMEGLGRGHLPDVFLGLQAGLWLLSFYTVCTSSGSSKE